MSTETEALHRLGEYVTGTEAGDVADRLEDGETLSASLQSVVGPRRGELRGLLREAGLGIEDVTRTVAVLRAVAGARSGSSSVTPLWTMPGHLAQGGPLTSSLAHLVEGARTSVTCSTFNFQRSSSLWDALREASERPEMTVRVYVDGRAALSGRGTPTTREVAQHLRGATVLESTSLKNRHVTSHAKFLAIDHRFLLTTSANFSSSAELYNVEFGVRIDDAGLTEAVEREMREAEGQIYVRIRSIGSAN